MIAEIEKAAARGCGRCDYSLETADDADSKMLAFACDYLRMEGYKIETTADSGSWEKSKTTVLIRWLDWNGCYHLPLIKKCWGFMSDKMYSYNAITAITERTLHKYVSQAQTYPEKAKELQSAFNGAFWLWFELTREGTGPDRDADGTRFLDLVLEFP